ncbi:KH domain-containing protein [Cinnamomum micranthum f. kanehirae]|uniref:KH domain-containing protein n=1 Tax=Cinnamomum micranthum f. kanehirae TaxID=337451 RepID=A0A3S3N2B3_9MAGN|nr:KH domain-containing protein [Cinnamomum micranthum f. kanehirae]
MRAEVRDLREQQMQTNRMLQTLMRGLPGFTESFQQTQVFISTVANFSNRTSISSRSSTVDPFPGANERVITIYCYEKSKNDKEIDEDDTEPLCPTQDAIIKVHCTIALFVDSSPIFFVDFMVLHCFMVLCFKSCVYMPKPSKEIFLIFSFVGVTSRTLLTSMSTMFAMHIGCGYNLPYRVTIFIRPRSEELIIRLLCPTDNLGRVIGRGGSFIKSVRQESGASVEVGDPRADSDHCVISITSTEVRPDNSTDDLKSSSVEAVLLLQGKINSNDGDDTVNISVLVPRRAIGCLIGKSGSIVNEIRQRTKADIRISKGKKPVCANDDDQLVEVIGEVDKVREALVQIVLRLHDDVLKERDGPHGALSSDSLFSGGPCANSNADSLYSGSSRNAPVADSLYSSALRSAPSDSLYSGGIALPSALSSIPPITPLSYDQRVESGSSLGRLSVGSLYGYGSLQDYIL